MDSETRPYIDMSDEPASRFRGAPWHLWVVGILALLWNSVGANDYLQTQMGNLAYFEKAIDESMGVSAAQAMEYFRGFPGWLVAFWALGVWGAVLGSILLLLRSRWADPAFVASLVGLGVTTFYQEFSPSPAWLKSNTNVTMSIVIWSIAVFLLIYAASMRRKGVLK
ncbi:MAG: hypothetical protein ABGW87_01705 [Sphingomonadaceae bacterium]